MNRPTPTTWKILFSKLKRPKARRKPLLYYHKMGLKMAGSEGGKRKPLFHPDWILSHK